MCMCVCVYIYIYISNIHKPSQIFSIYYSFQNNPHCPDQCGSISWSVAPAKGKVAGLIPDQGTYLGCRFSSQSGCIREATGRCFSPSHSPSLPLSLQINK